MFNVRVIAGLSAIVVLLSSAAAPACEFQQTSAGTEEGAKQLLAQANQQANPGAQPSLERYSGPAADNKTSQSAVAEVPAFANPTASGSR